MSINYIVQIVDQQNTKQIVFLILKIVKVDERSFVNIVNCIL